MSHLWCRVFHFGYWTAVARPETAIGRYAWLRCGRCHRSYSIRLVIVAPAPPGKTPAWPAREGG